ncbi:MAG: alpha/beta fold hydrolase [Mariprofundaceae bacterium]|nr:alpha/beta fold hydrolase [Mariprofundaceae bacterium]
MGAAASFFKGDNAPLLCIVRLMQQQLLFIKGPVGQLQAIYQTGKHGYPAVVLCHPHPLYGGTMRNKVVYWMARALNDGGCSVLRFNFRGVERSDGVWDDGRGEANDASAALAYMRQQHPDAPLWLAGFSFGCYAGLQAASINHHVTQMIAVAPAVHMHDFSFMAERITPVPCTVIAAKDDEIVPYDVLQAWAMTCPSVDWYSIAGAGHFFPQHRDMLQKLLREQVEKR